MGEVQSAARTLGVEITKLEIRRVEDIAPAFEALASRTGAKDGSVRLYTGAVKLRKIYAAEKAYPANSGFSICSGRDAPDRPALFRGLSRLMMSQ
jgi:hypothetical protein